MHAELLHIFRNTPFGREVFLHSLHFCRLMGLELAAYIPETRKFLLYFEYDAVQVDLDEAYLADPDTAEGHMRELAEPFGVPVRRITIENYTATNLPDLPTDFEFMTCPRIISDLSTKIALGKLGSKVRAILRNAPFPVLIPAAVYKPFNSLCVLFGGSENAVRSLHLGLRMARDSGLPLDVFTMDGLGRREELESILAEHNLDAPMAEYARQWRIFETGDFETNLYDVPHDALVVLGAYGHGIIKKVMFGSKMELVQSTLPNSLLIAGPNFATHPWYKTETAKLAEE